MMQPRCLLDVIELHNIGSGVKAWEVTHKSGAHSGYFHDREQALAHAKNEWPELPEEINQ